MVLQARRYCDCCDKSNLYLATATDYEAMIPAHLEHIQKLQQRIEQKGLQVREKRLKQHFAHEQKHKDEVLKSELLAKLQQVQGQHMKAVQRFKHALLGFLGKEWEGLVQEFARMTVQEEELDTSIRQVGECLASFLLSVYYLSDFLLRMYYASAFFFKKN